MSALKPTATPFLPTGSKSWADDDDEDDDITKDFAALSPKKETTRVEKPAEESKASTTQEDQPVASLASRISGLSTSNDPPPPSKAQFAPQTEAEAPSVTKGSETRPKFNAGGNNLFGRALAGANRPASSSTSTAASSSKPTEERKEENPVQEEKKDQDKMTVNLMDNTDQWGNQIVDGKAKQGSGGDGFDEPAKARGSSVGEFAGDGTSTNGENGEHKDSMIDERMSEGTGLISNEFQVEVKLADLQANPDSPLYSIKAFEELPIHPDLLKGVYAAKFKKPSKIQEKALPMLLINPPRNLIGQSQSGTGKTAAFTLNMLSRVDPSMMTPQAICLAPSRELARQIQEVVDNIGQFTQVKTHLAVPGSWSRNVKIDKQILIGTPGTIVDMLSRGGKIFDPKQIRVFVLDEADEMLQMQSLGDQTRRIKRMLPPGVQNVLFSATFPDEVRQFAQEFAPEANQIFLKKEDITVDAIKQLYLECEGEEQKYNALSALYDIMTIGQSIVFCKRRDTADRIAHRLTEEGHSVASLHGEKLSNERDDILDKFRNGQTKVLITTNVVARGIDIQQVNMVVNYDVPDLGPQGDHKPDIETYIHRIGRTGRFGRKGCSVIFAHDQNSMEDVRYIADSLGKRMSKINVTRQTDLDQLEAALKAAMKGTDPK